MSNTRLQQANGHAITTVTTVRKQAEFDAFIEIIERGKVEHWSVVAEALGVREATINEWKKHPLAREAIASGIQRCLEKMEEVGSGDWRMWREKLKILGVRDRDKEIGQATSNTFTSREFWERYEE